MLAWVLLQNDGYLRIKGVWYYLYRAVDKYGDIIDFMLSEHIGEAGVKAALETMNLALFWKSLSRENC